MTSPNPSDRPPLHTKNVVATSQPDAVEAGIAMLRQGGNAVDAALGAAIALTVVEPTSNGIGSDAFAIVWDGKGLHGLNASGRSPAGWTPERFAYLDEMPERGWDAVTVPGAVSAWVELSSKFGRLEFEKLFEPAIECARNGYRVTPVTAAAWARGSQILADQPGFAEEFCPAPAAGSVFKSEAMAKTLERIAETKGEAFYRGDLATKVVAFSEAGGGALTLEDLAEHRADWCGTVSTSFHGFEIHEIPPNGQGIAALIALGLLERIDGFADLDPDSPESLHLQIEAIKVAFADLHQHVSDPVSMEVRAEDLLNADYLQARSLLIQTDKAVEFVPGVPGPAGTVFLTAADENGMMISFIQSNYMGFGSGIVVPGTGISLQNRGCGFRSKPGHVNSVGPRKRPFHTIIPAFAMRNGIPEMSFGVMGGPMQAQGHVQMAVRVLMHGQAPQEASDAPRWQVMDDGTLAVEAAMPKRTLDCLSALGHRVLVAPDSAFGGAQLIRRQVDGYVAGSDHRKDGLASGY